MEQKVSPLPANAPTDDARAKIVTVTELAEMFGARDAKKTTVSRPCLDV